jgi:hypothetical protein
MFLHPELNNPVRVAINLYQNLVFTAIKAHVYAREMRRSGLGVVRPELWLRAWEEATTFAQTMLHKHNPGLLLPVRWFGFKAIISVLKRKPTDYRHVTLPLFEEVCADLFPRRPWAIDFDSVLGSGSELLDNILF